MEYYEVLGVERTASVDEISRVYRQKAIQYHPDKNPSSEALLLFKKCTEAYEVLTDAAKRSQYDVQGYVGRRPPNFRPPSPQKPKEPVKKPKTAEDFRKEREEAEAKREPTKEMLEAVQCSYFGGENTGRGRDIQAHLFLKPQELRSGGKFTILLKRRELCNRCIGDGNTRQPCPICSRQSSFDRMVNDYCPKCHGDRDVLVPCKTCKGEGVDRWSINEVVVPVPAGSMTGQQIRLIGEGECAPLKMPGYAQIVLLEKA